MQVFHHISHFLLSIPCRVILLIVIITSFTACHKDSSTTSSENTEEQADSAAVKFYRMRMQGDFDTYVANMHSCSNMPADYKRRIVIMLRQHQKEVEQNKQGISDVKVLRTETHDNGKMVNVFLGVTYKDGSNEEILFPVVYDGNVWKIQQAIFSLFCTYNESLR